MIIRENFIEVEEQKPELSLNREGCEYTADELIFFDLEHYVYKKPKCVGVFGACTYNEKEKRLHVTQYMIENKGEVVDILYLAKKYFMSMKKMGKKVIVTFSGNNDFTVINYLFNKYNINYSFSQDYDFIDIQKEYERDKNTSIGLKNLEKIFEINRGSELISGSNLAKTFHKVLKDKEYIERMPKEKIETILLYNEQDVVSLHTMFINWKKYIEQPKVEEELEDVEEIEETDEIQEIQGNIEVASIENEEDSVLENLEETAN